MAHYQGCPPAGPGPAGIAPRSWAGPCTAAPLIGIAPCRVACKPQYHSIPVVVKTPSGRTTSVDPPGAAASLDPRSLPPLAARGTGGNERDRSFRSPRDPSPHPLTPSPHRRARRRPRSRHRGRRWDPHRPPRPTFAGQMHWARTRPSPPLSTLLRTPQTTPRAAVAFHFFARAGSATFHFFARAGSGS